jgi:hypothetical protein
MRLPVLSQLIATESQLRRGLGTDTAAPGPLPRFADERSDVLQLPVIEAARQKLLVRALDDQTRGFGRTLT